MSDEGLQLELKKPLDKMTAKELRELVMNQIPQITGASGMGKEEILAAIKVLTGGDEEGGQTNPYKGQILSLKKEITELRGKKAETPGKGARKDRSTLRKKINKLKKRTRRLAAAGQAG